MSEAANDVVKETVDGIGVREVVDALKDCVRDVLRRCLATTGELEVTKAEVGTRVGDAEAAAAAA